MDDAGTNAHPKVNVVIDLQDTSRRLRETNGLLSSFLEHGSTPCVEMYVKWYLGFMRRIDYIDSVIVVLSICEYYIYKWIAWVYAGT